MEGYNNRHQHHQHTAGPSYAGLLLVLCCLTCLPASGHAGIAKSRICEHNIVSVSEAGGRPQTGKSPFQITTNQNKYIPGRPTLVSIRTSIPLQGFVLQARHVGTPKVLGRFKDVPQWVSLHNCEGTNNTISAWFDRPSLRNVTLTWVSPDVDLGTVHFLGTVYKDQTTFWTNLQSKRFRKGFAAIDLDNCGVNKNCFRYTQPGETTCSQESCIYLVTSRVEGPNAHFEISAKADWAAIGFSSDDRMGGDDVFMCMRTRFSGEVRHYWNDYAYQTPHLQEMNPLFNHEVEVTEDGRIACRFSRLLKVANGNQFNIDLNNDWYQLYAWGPLSQSGTLMRHTLDNPSVSVHKMTLLRNRDDISAAHSTLWCGASTSGLLLLPTALLLHLVLPALPCT